jgi:hypothetical protein
MWARVRAHQGEIFHQIRGGEFTYVMDGNRLILDRTNHALHRSQLEQALTLVPLKNTVPL